MAANCHDLSGLVGSAVSHMGHSTERLFQVAACGLESSCQHASWWVKVFAHADRKCYRYIVKTDSDGIKPLNRLQKLGREKKNGRKIPLKRNRIIKI